MQEEKRTGMNTDQEKHEEKEEEDQERRKREGKKGKTIRQEEGAQQHRREPNEGLGRLEYNYKT